MLVVLLFAVVAGDRQFLVVSVVVLLVVCRVVAP